MRLPSLDIRRSSFPAGDLIRPRPHFRPVRHSGYAYCLDPHLVSSSHAAFPGFNSDSVASRVVRLRLAGRRPDQGLVGAAPLALGMAWKCSLVGLPYGGAKGSVVVDPHIRTLRRT